MEHESTSDGGLGAGSETTAESHARILAPEARRALEEAAARRAKAEGAQREAEIGGRGGLDPARYGDWEVKGLASDF